MSLMMQPSGSNSEANSCPFQGSLLANGESAAANSAVTVVVLDDTAMQEAGTSLTDVNSLQPAKPKRRKSNPKSWKKNKIKNAKAAGM